MVEVYINNDQNTVEVGNTVILIETVIKAGLNFEGICEPVEISVSYLDNASIQQLNKEYRNCDAPTDVLSFSQEEGSEFLEVPGLPRILGDVVISLEQAVAQSQEYNHSFLRELGYLVAHGLLHLLGYDHLTEEERQSMRCKEERIMAAVNLSRDLERT